MFEKEADDSDSRKDPGTANGGRVAFTNFEGAYAKGSVRLRFVGSTLQYSSQADPFFPTRCCSILVSEAQQTAMKHMRYNIRKKQSAH